MVSVVVCFVELIVEDVVALDPIVVVLEVNSGLEVLALRVVLIVVIGVEALVLCVVEVDV